MADTGKTALIIPIYNRPEYLKRCLESLLKADVRLDYIILINDASNNPETIQLFNNFIYRCEVIKIDNKHNVGIKENLKKGYNLAFALGCDIAMHLDSDIIVKPNFVEVLLSLQSRFPDNIICGFNSTNINKDGTLRNPIVCEYEDYIEKMFANGPNLCLNSYTYEKYVYPALFEDGNWDYNTSLHCQKAKLPIIVAKPSVVQHIGIHSSMGHGIEEQPDIALDFFNLSLPDVTLLGIDWKNAAGIIRAGDICRRDIEFGAVQIITDIKIDGRDMYSHWCIKEMSKYITTSHVLVIHADGYIVNWQAWDNEWLKYDYVGATWGYKDNMNVGNGGFSLRSKRLQDILAKDDRINDFHPEDDKICRKYRPYLEKVYGIKFAPEEMANKFSIEAYGSSVFQGGNKYNGQFGFHGANIDFTGSGIPEEILFSRTHNMHQYVQHPNNLSTFRI